MLALFTLSADGAVAADHAAAEAATMTSDPARIAQGDDLSARAALCSVSKVEPGKLKSVPRPHP
jgi:hypothetical protein